MARLPIIELWDDARCFVARELPLLLPLAFATFGLGTLIAGYFAPASQPQVVTAPGAWMLAMLPAGLLMLIGYLAISHIALRSHASIGEGLHAAIRLLPRAIALMLLIIAAMTLATMVIGLVTGLLAVTLGLGQHGGVMLMLVAMLPPLLWISIRLAVLWPALADREGPVGDTLRMATAMTRGRAAPIAGLMLASGVIYLVLAVVIELAGGSVLMLVARLLSMPGLGQLLLSILVAGFNAIYLLFWSVVLTRLYRALAAG